MKYNGKRTWVFYYTETRDGEKIVIGFINCVRPERTNLRKEQKGYWQRSNVVGTGYTTELDSPDLVYPFSNLTVKN